MSTTEDSVIGLPLRDAVDRFKQLPGSWGNAYEWWRRSAQQYGQVSFGEPRQLNPDSKTTVAVQKVGTRWLVDPLTFEAALAEHVAAQVELEMITIEYEKHHLLVASGGRLRTRWGGYRVSEDFHRRENSRAGSASWVCNRCWEAASRENNREECHTCRDWGSCGRDCTLSAVSCERCGTSLEI